MARGERVWEAGELLGDPLGELSDAEYERLYFGRIRRHGSNPSEGERTERERRRAAVGGLARALGWKG